jgi:hypothetical protein
VRKGTPYRFNFLNLYKSDSLYNHGLLPLVYSVTNAANGVGWVRSGTQGMSSFIISAIGFTHNRVCNVLQCVTTITAHGGWPKARKMLGWASHQPTFIL